MKLIGKSVASVLTGSAVTVAWMWAGVNPRTVAAAIVGAVLAIGLLYMYLWWFTATIERSEGTAWIGRVPRGMLRRPLKAILRLLEQREEAFEAAIGRERLREVEMEAMTDRMAGLEAAVAESRIEVLELLRVIDLADVADEDFVGLQKTAMLRSLAREPAEAVGLGDVVVDSVARLGWAPGSVVIRSALPSIVAPRALIQALVDNVLAGFPGLGTIDITGRVDGGMAVVTFDGVGAPSEHDSSIAIAVRAAMLVGGRVFSPDGRGPSLAIPLRQGPGMPHPGELPWDPPDAA